MLFRLILLVAIAGGLLLFALSNMQALPLVFLGIQTPALPLAWWMLGAIAAGALTTLTISLLFNLSSFATGREVRSQFRRATQGNRVQESRRSPFQPKPPASEANRSSPQSATSDEGDAAWKNWDGYDTAPAGAATSPPDRKQTTRTPASQDADDDWDTDFGDDWEGPATGASAQTPTDRHRAEPSAKGRDYEAKQEPKSSSRSGSVYTYSYKDSKKPDVPGAKKREAVVDAEYRVLIPPYQPSSDSRVEQDRSTAEENAEDWFEDQDEDATGGDRRR